MTCVKIVVVSAMIAPDHIARIYIPDVSGKTKGGQENDMKKNKIKETLKMKDSNKKYIKLSELMLEVEYLTPLWATLRKESERLENLGFGFEF